jgi:hypothetical protein
MGPGVEAARASTAWVQPPLLILKADWTSDVHIVVGEKSNALERFHADIAPSGAFLAHSRKMEGKNYTLFSTFSNSKLQLPRLANPRKFCLQDNKAPSLWYKLRGFSRIQAILKRLRDQFQS